MPIKIFHFHNGSGGGVLSVIRNLLYNRQHAEIENHVVYTINKDGNSVFQIPDLEGAASEQVFYYSAKWNFYYTVKQLAKLLPDEQAVVVAHDWLELGMVSNLGLQNPVVFFVHGDYDYYYQLAAKHFRSIDVFICVSTSITNRLKEMLPTEAANIKYARFPVPHSSTASLHLNDTLQIIFIGRCERAKGYNLLPEIDKRLQFLGIKAGWHVAGEGSDLSNNQNCWPVDADVHFYGKLSPNELSQLLLEVDLLVLPSLAEGMPVSIIEAMKAAVVPIVNNLPGGIQELVVNGTTGYKIEQNLPDGFAVIIKQLNDDRNMLNVIGKKASLVANRLFDPLINTNAIEVILLHSLIQNKPKKSFKAYGSRLDQRWIPNIFVNCVRSLFPAYK